MEGVTGPGAASNRPPLPPPQRPEFPPPSLGLVPAFAGQNLDTTAFGPDVLMVAGFIHNFSDLFGLRPPPSADQLAQVRHAQPMPRTCDARVWSNEQDAVD